MKNHRLGILVVVVFMLSATGFAQVRPRAEWGAPLVDVKHSGKNWIITGKRHKVAIDETNLAMKIQAGPVDWAMAPSEADDLTVKSRGELCQLHLTDAGKIVIEPYDTGAKTGVKITLSQFRHGGMLNKGQELDLTLYLTVCLEGAAEELVCDAMAAEHETTVRKLDWPKEIDTRGAEYTALNNVRGNLLPVTWPKAYHPYRNVPAGQEDLIKTDKSYIQSNLIECWSMAWWGFEKKGSALVVIVETSDDAAYKFDHPAGGPTVIGPEWLPSLGKLAYPRSVRFAFIDKGNYVDMAKRYRKYVIDSGLFVSLREKIARQPLVAKLIGAPHVSYHALTNYKQNGHRFDPAKPEANYNVKTFEAYSARLRELKAAGIDNVFSYLAGWPNQGYDRQHPDVLPPAPPAGGWDGFKRWYDTCLELGYTPALHDQYRDYYIDAPSWDPQFAVHEETSGGDASAFPGTRFGGWKDGYLPMMDYWDGGAMGYLNSRFALAHLVKNYRMMLDRGIKIQASNMDVFGYVPPTEDFNPEHPQTRADDMKGRAACFAWARANIGAVGTEAGCDWVIPYVDFCSGAKEGACIPAPLYELVYHDAIMADEGGTGNYMRCMLNGSFPGVPRDLNDAKQMERMRDIIALHKKVALLEMTNHEFLDKSYKKERTTFADGTTVTIDRDTTGTVEVKYGK